MPINKVYPYGESITALEDIVDISGEKPCIGIMLFHNFMAKGKNVNYTNSLDNVMEIIDTLDAKKCRLSFCEYNGSEEIGRAEIYSSEMAKKLLAEVQKKGFEAKLFSSFGQSEKAACGMLGGKKPQFCSSRKWNELNNYADELILKYTN